MRRTRTSSSSRSAPRSVWPATMLCSPGIRQPLRRIGSHCGEQRLGDGGEAVQWGSEARISPRRNRLARSSSASAERYGENPRVVGGGGAKIVGASSGTRGAARTTTPRRRRYGGIPGRDRGLPIGGASAPGTTNPVICFDAPFLPQASTETRIFVNLWLPSKAKRRRPFQGHRRL